MTDSSEHAVLVARFNFRPEAEIARGFLEAAGISSALQVDDGGGAFGAPLTFTAGSFASILVLEEDAGAARSLLSDNGFTVLDDAGNEVPPPPEAADEGSADDVS